MVWSAELYSAGGELCSPPHHSPFKPSPHLSPTSTDLATGKDLISKQLLKRLLLDFGTQLFGLDIVEAELLSSEQPRIEGKRADLVARVKESQGASYILHVEVQNANQTDIPIRMLRYYTDLALEHTDEAIKQYLLYIGKAPLSMSDHLETPAWRYCYEVLDMRSKDSDYFLSSDNPDALVLAILCDLKGREPRAIVAHIVKKLVRLHGDKLDNLRNSLMMLDVLASNRDLQSLVKENHDMFVDIEKTSLYQLGVERGVEQGSERRQQKIVLNLLAKLPPEQVAEFNGVPLTEVNAIAKANKPN